jgi:chorismate mutase
MFFKVPIALSSVIRYNVHYRKTIVFIERTFDGMAKQEASPDLSNPKGSERYYLVREDILPEAVLKTMQVKELLAQGDAKTVHEAAERIGISRSAFYKYKDGIYALSKLDKERIVTISLDLQHRSGILSKVLAMVANYDGNVLTINQTIPLQGMANVVISVDTSTMGENMPLLLGALRDLDGAKRAQVIGQG